MLSEFLKTWKTYINELKSLSSISAPITLADGKLDYSAVLPGLQRENGYKLILTISKPIIKGRLYSPAGKNTGIIEGHIEKGALQIADVIITAPSDIGHGFGVAMYEALYAHAYNILGIKRVVGVEHSCSAARVHAALAKKYGFQYAAASDVGDSRDASSMQHKSDFRYDRAYSNYSYKLH